MSTKKPLNKKLLGKVTVDPSMDKDNGRIICPEKYEMVKERVKNPDYLKAFLEAVEKNRQ